MCAKWIGAVLLVLLWQWAGTQSVLAQAGTQASAAPGKLFRIDPKTPEGLRELLAYSAEGTPLVSAHRGGPMAGYPENCIATFEHTLAYGFAMLEIDPRYAKDGAIVVHHDPTLERTTTGKGRLTDFSLDELKQLKLKDTLGSVTEQRMPTLDEVLEWGRGKTVLVLDQKDVPTAARVKKIEEHQAESYAMLIVYSFQDAQECFRLNPNVMMEVMIPNLEKAAEFDTLGIPWRNVIAFVGHVPPENKGLYELIHAKGAKCMIGTSRNLDRQVITGKVAEIQELEPGYREFLARGADVIETDIPVLLAPMLYGKAAVPTGFRKWMEVR
jgi:glycerophosphoryl diester phosphodiesterase